MNVQQFHTIFEKMRTENRGRQFERRELGILATTYGIYFNSTMWAAGLSNLFNVGKVGPKYVYSFKNFPTSVEAVAALSERVRAYKRDNVRTIEHAKAILRRYNIHNID